MVGGLLQESGVNSNNVMMIQKTYPMLTIHQRKLQANVIAGLSVRCSNSNGTLSTYLGDYGWHVLQRWLLCLCERGSKEGI